MTGGVDGHYTGLELLFHVSRQDVRRKCDALMLYVHWKLLSRGFRCIGRGEAAKEGEVATPTELLPEGWCSDQEVYILRYVMGGSGYLLKAVVVGDQLLLNFMRRSDEYTTSTSIVVSHFVREEFSTYVTAYNNLPGLDSQLSQELLTGLDPQSEAQRKMAHGCTTSCSEGEEERGRRRRGDGAEAEPDPLRIGQPRYPTAHTGASHWWPPGQTPAIPVGRADLDPLGRGIGGGMLMDPRGPPFSATGGGGLFPGGLHRGPPPGARFDPFMPPDADGAQERGRLGRHGIRMGPDSDELPPPGSGDMFM